MSLTDAAAFPASPEEAADAANAAASKAGVEIRLLEDVDDFTLVAELFQSIWTKQGEASPVNVETLRALSKAGSYVGGAFEHDELVGACFGFFAAPEQRALHSHIAGVSSRMRVAASASPSRCTSARGRSRRVWTRSPGRSIPSSAAMRTSTS